MMSVVLVRVKWLTCIATMSKSATTKSHPPTCKDAVDSKRVKIVVGVKKKY